ncbi:helix-turn-helix domain-containing protein [Pseudonocardia sp.]|uniref:helix-turn-helix domain-containing protein n=1 Tax=Pseudonocardia sp. TaxID=60912 RepID=UPI003D14F82C
MVMTLRTLLGRSGSRLSVHAGADHLDRGVTWTAEDVADPAAQLQGGELVLTTAAELAARRCGHVERLAAAGAAGLCVLAQDGAPVPTEAIAAAERAGLALLTAPTAAAFAAVARDVAVQTSEEQLRGLSEALAAQRDLARAALAPHAAREIVDRLAKALSSWVLLLDETGGLRAGTPAGRVHLARIRIDLSRLRDGSRSASLSMTVAGDAVVMLPLTVRGRVRGFLAVGRSTPLAGAEQSVVTCAVALLRANLIESRGVTSHHRRHRLAIFKIAIEGDVALAAGVGEVLGTGCPEGELRVALLGVPRGHEIELLECAESNFALRTVRTLVAEWEPGRVVVLMPPAEGDIRTLESVLRQVPHARGAVSDPVPPRELPDAWRHVRSVFSSAPGTAGKLALASDVATAGLLRHLSGDDARGWAEAALAPLAATAHRSKIDLRHTLRTFLAHNGQADASASALGIHRHTLRYRMGKVAEALGRDIDDPMTRAELWVALQLIDQP